MLPKRREGIDEAYFHLIPYFHLTFTLKMTSPFLHYSYTHFNTLGKKALGKHCGKISNFTCSAKFSMQLVSSNPLIATFQMSSAASLHLGGSQNGVLGNELVRKQYMLEQYYTKIDSVRDTVTFVSP